MPKIAKAVFLLALSVLMMGAETLTDPTRPPRYQVSQSVQATGQTLSLTATFLYPTYRLAIINGEVAKIGDQLGEYTVITITPFTVELLGPQNAKEVLHLAPMVKQLRLAKGF